MISALEIQETLSTGHSFTVNLSLVLDEISVEYIGFDGTPQFESQRFENLDEAKRIVLAILRRISREEVDYQKVYHAFRKMATLAEQAYTFG